MLVSLHFSGEAQDAIACPPSWRRNGGGRILQGLEIRPPVRICVGPERPHPASDDQHLVGQAAADHRRQGHLEGRLSVDAAGQGERMNVNAWFHC